MGFDASGHYHGADGRFARIGLLLRGGKRSRVTDPKTQLAHGDYAGSLYRDFGRGMPEYTDRVFRTRRGIGGRTSVRRTKPALYTRDDGIRDEVRVTERYDRGRLGPATSHPRGGTYRPVLRVAGWKQIHTQVMPAGYLRAMDQQAAERAIVRGNRRAKLR